VLVVSNTGNFPKPFAVKYHGKFFQTAIPRSQWELMSGRRVLQLVRRWGFTAGLLAALCRRLRRQRAKPEFGPNVLIFDPSMPSQEIQKRINAVYATQEHNEFGPEPERVRVLATGKGTVFPDDHWTRSDDL